MKNGVADNCDRFLQSWATWEWKTFCRESNESVHGKSQWAEYGSCKTGYGVPWNVTTNRPFKAKYLARTHARAVSGNITSMKFDAQTGKFELRYELDLTIKMPSEIFMSTEYYYHRESNISSGGNSNPFLSLHLEYKSIQRHASELTSMRTTICCTCPLVTRNLVRICMASKSLSISPKLGAGRYLASLVIFLLV